MDSCQQDNKSDFNDSQVYLSITNGLTWTRPVRYFSQSLNTGATVIVSMRSSCQSQMVCLGQDSWDMCENHRSVTVQRMVSGIKSEQASNVYLFTQVRKAWEGHTVRSTSEYYYILAYTCAMINCDRLLVSQEIQGPFYVVVMNRYLLCC